MRNRIKDVGFNEKITYANLYKAYLNARKGKRYRDDVIKFSMREEDYIESICYELKNGIYEFGEYREFYVYEPKKRRILSAPFRDRIVHTWYVENFLEKYFVPDFIINTYACIKGRGMHKCALKVKKDIYNEYMVNPDSYIIKMDVSKFFASIDRNILYEIIENKIEDKYFLNFTKKILESASKYDEIDGIGIPIGNYTSQMYGNIYLSQIDEYITKVLLCTKSYRYMDDTCIIVENKLKAKEVLNKIIEFYDKVLKLKLNNKTQIFKIKQGLNFCGYKIKIGRMYIRSRGKKKLVKKLKYIRKNIFNGEISIEEAVRKLAGHVGYMKIANVRKLVDKYFYLKT